MRERPDTVVPSFALEPRRSEESSPFSDARPLEKSIGGQDPKIWIAQFTSINRIISSISTSITTLTNAVTTLQNLLSPVLTSTTPTYTVAGLPSAIGRMGARSFVTDNFSTFALAIGTAATAGGSNKVPVYSDGTSWIVG